MRKKIKLLKQLIQAKKCDAVYSYRNELTFNTKGKESYIIKCMHDQFSQFSKK